MNGDINCIPSNTPDFQTELAEKLAELAPEAIADGKIDVEKLKELLADDADESNERFGLFWPGKRRALRAAQQPTTATLKPDVENSKDWDTTKNVFIEGDNLEVLKVLQKHYHGKIKMIYIDPPYNTGKDFVYPDNFKEGLDTYLEWTKQVNEEGRKLSTNSESEGRFHSNWLNMMYPRLKLARNLLKGNGFIAVSIGDEEVAHLRLLMNNIFGERNCIAQVAVNRTSDVATERTVQKVEYLLFYARSIEKVEIGAADKIVESRGTVGNQDQTMPEIEFPAGLRCSGIADGEYQGARQIPDSRENIELLSSAVVKDGRLASPVTMKARWRASNDMRNFFANHCLPTKAKISGMVIDIYLEGDRFMPKIVKQSVEKLPTYFGTNKRGSKDLDSLGIEGFEYPKSVDFIKWILSFGLRDDEYVLDFFAGSGTIAQAVYELNEADQGRRSYLAVQLPEPVESGPFRTISQLARKRIALAGDQTLQSGTTSLDVGFRAYKLSDTSFSKWQVSSDTPANELEQHLLELRESANDNATPADLFVELLLKQGYSLTEDIGDASIAGLDLKTILDADGDVAVLAYLDEHTKPTLDQLREIADSKPVRFVILEDCFQGDDELKTNLVQICKTNGIELWTA